MRLSRHGKTRIKERVGIGKSDKRLNKMAKKAIQRGIRHKDTKGSLHRYMNYLYANSELEGKQRKKLVTIYANKAWIFVEGKLVTVLNLPHRFISNLNDYLTNEYKENKDARKDYDDEDVFFDDEENN